MNTSFEDNSLHCLFLAFNHYYSQYYIYIFSFLLKLGYLPMKYQSMFK